MFFVSHLNHLWEYLVFVCLCPHFLSSNNFLPRHLDNLWEDLFVLFALFLFYFFSHFICVPIIPPSPWSSARILGQIGEDLLSLATDCLVWKFQTEIRLWSHHHHHQLKKKHKKTTTTNLRPSAWSQSWAQRSKRAESAKTAPLVINIIMTMIILYDGHNNDFDYWCHHWCHHDGRRWDCSTDREVSWGRMLENIPVDHRVRNLRVFPPQNPFPEKTCFRWNSSG